MQSILWAERTEKRKLIDDAAPNREPRGLYMKGCTMFVLHVICRKFLHVKPIGNYVYESGYWPITDEDAERLVRGMLYLHEAKAKLSYFGGIVDKYREAGQDSVHSDRMVFTFRASSDGCGAPWRGKKHRMAWVGGVVWIPD